MRAAASWKSPGAAPTRSRYPPANFGSSWKMATRSRSAATASAKASPASAWERVPGKLQPADAPLPDPAGVDLRHRLPGLAGKCLLEFGHVHHRAIDAELGRRVRVRLHLQPE